MKNSLVMISLIFIASICYSQSKPSICPIKDFNGKTVEFGKQMHPILKVERDHNAVDFMVPEGTPVLATANGKVIQAEQIDNYGVVVRIQHAKNIRTFYAHLSKVIVKKGQMVKQNQVIAYSGNTGLSTGPHLHYEVIEKGVSVNPRDFIVQK